MTEKNTQEFFRGHEQQANACLVNRNKLLGDVVLVISLVILRYSKNVFIQIYTMIPSIWPL